MNRCIPFSLKGVHDENFKKLMLETHSTNVFLSSVACRFLALISMLLYAASRSLCRWRWEKCSHSHCTGAKRRNNCNRRFSFRYPLNLSFAASEVEFEFLLILFAWNLYWHAEIRQNMSTCQKLGYSPLISFDKGCVLDNNVLVCFGPPCMMCYFLL